MQNIRNGLKVLTFPKLLAVIKIKPIVNIPNHMKKTLIVASVILLGLAVSTRADDEASKKGEKPKSTPSAEEKVQRKQLIEKYDTNKNNRLDKEERSKMTPEDLEKWNKFSPEKSKPAEAPKKKEHSQKEHQEKQ